MTLASSIALFATMFVLAISPGPSAAVVMARGLNGGMRSAVITTAGIVSADYVFILLAIFGLSAAAQTMGSLFIWIKYAGAAYLVYLGFSMLFSNSRKPLPQINKPRSTDFLAGLFTTLANPKAIVFYVSFFPAFLDIKNVSLLDMLIVITIITSVLVPSMLTYAYMAIRSHQALKEKSSSLSLVHVSGAMLLASGVWLGLKSN